MIENSQRIQEAHGLWELQVQRLAALVEGSAGREKLKVASREERAAFENWQRVSKECGA